VKEDFIFLFSFFFFFNMSQITVRLSNPDDLLFICEGIISAFDGHLQTGYLRSVYPSLSTEQLTEALSDTITRITKTPEMKEKTPFNLHSFLIAEVGDHRVGTMMPYVQQPRAFDVFEDEIEVSVRNLFGEEVWAQGFALLRRMDPGFELVNEHEEGFKTEIIYVVKEYRGKGVLAALFTKAFEMARSMGQKSAALWTFSDNRRAIQAYKKYGFEIMFKFTFPEFKKIVGAKGFVIMEVDLTKPSEWNKDLDEQK
jgi:GNAT superfamily N-acetyltransferase